MKLSKSILATTLALTLSAVFTGCGSDDTAPSGGAAGATSPNPVAVGTEPGGSPVKGAKAETPKAEEPKVEAPK